MDPLGRREIFLFEGFQLDRRGLFRRDERGTLTPVAIGGRALDLLHFLIEHEGEVRSRTEIMAAVPQTAVEESNLAFQVAALRRVLDRERTRRSEVSCIQTVARRGYRFAAPVTRFEPRELGEGPPIARAGAFRLPPLSIVVLPFANLSTDYEQGHFADGITEDLTTDLSKISGHFVISSGTAFAHAGKSTDAKQLQRELGVHYVVQGNVRRSGNRLRMNVQLSEAETVRLLWAERFEIDRRSISAAEDEIVGFLVRTLRLELLENADRRSRTKSGPPDAHDLLLRGWACFCRPRSASTLHDARRDFERALELEPSSVDARIGLATVLVASVLEEWSDPILQNPARVEQLLSEVFGRVTNDSMAHQAMAMLRRSQNRLTETRIEAERAVTLDRNNSGALYELGLAYMFLGQPSAGIPHIEKAIALSSRDPLLADMYFGLARCHLLLDRFDEAIELLYRVRAVRPQRWDIHMWLAGALGLQGDLDGAKAELNEGITLKPEINSLSRWRAHQPSIGVPRYWALYEQTLIVGLRRAGFPEE